MQYVIIGLFFLLISSLIRVYVRRIRATALKSIETAPADAPPDSRRAA